MALPSSGQISMGDINEELGRTRTTANTSLAGGSTPTGTSLFGLASGINITAPHQISEFWGYSNVTEDTFLWDIYLTSSNNSALSTPALGGVGFLSVYDNTAGESVLSLGPIYPGHSSYHQLTLVFGHDYLVQIYADCSSGAYPECNIYPGPPSGYVLNYTLSNYFWDSIDTYGEESFDITNTSPLNPPDPYEVLETFAYIDYM